MDRYAYRVSEGCSVRRSWILSVWETGSDIIGATWDGLVYIFQEFRYIIRLGRRRTQIRKQLMARMRAEQHNVSAEPQTALPLRSDERVVRITPSENAKSVAAFSERNIARDFVADGETEWRTLSVFLKRDGRHPAIMISAKDPLKEDSGDRVMHIRRFREESESVDVLSEMFLEGYRPATHSEILAFHRAHPEMLQGYKILIALGSLLVTECPMNGPQLKVAALHQLGEKYSLMAYTLSTRWDADSGFLLVRNDAVS